MNFVLHFNNSGLIKVDKIIFFLSKILLIIREKVLENNKNSGKTHGKGRYKTDGTSFNTRHVSGLMTKMVSNREWPIKIHCFNHCVELTVKDAFLEFVFNPNLVGGG